MVIQTSVGQPQDAVIGEYLIMIEELRNKIIELQKQSIPLKLKPTEDQSTQADNSELLNIITTLKIENEDLKLKSSRLIQEYEAKL